MKKKPAKKNRGTQKNNHKKRNYIIIFFSSFFLAVLIGSLFLSALYLIRIIEKSEKTEILNDALASGQTQEIGVIPFPGTEPEVKQDTVEISETIQDESVTFSFAGDVMFDDSYSIMNYYRSTGGNVSECFDQELLDMMKQADVFMVNNECTFTNRGVPTEGKAYT
ncbi:MAG: CapA family protein, partial [Lachnospiraceae bacterium]|nr:CapA family protein [Lachnospiraceae bacterium]